ncbi:kinase-like domain-containing protein [Apiosordaria backusii]|uniref:Kinase-like domain-containing protein n=1 Tax=Apiosordaria backusii TaxID=314023 RepID=A0AA40ESF9_9PEZI|nr:kinase-like domain-containing protein [Apiosordaria backusii]
MPRPNVNDNEEQLPKLSRMRYPDAVQGKEIYNVFGNRVIETTTPSGVVLAVKVKPPQSFDRSEAEMMQYAASNGVLTPNVRGVYEIITHMPLARVMVSELVPGVSLDQVWHDMTAAQQSSIKDQLRTQLARMRSCTQPFIGRLGRQATRNNFDSLGNTQQGPFDSEEEFDNWCLARLRGNALSRWKWKKFVERERRGSSGSFVLTHGDLTPRNIMVKDGVITGIIDWERSGFFPGYAEYAFAMKLCHSHEDWWIPVLKEVLSPCSKERLEFTELIER